MGRSRSGAFARRSLGVRARLGDKVALIGFCGAPWTVASYIVGGGRPEGRELARGVAHECPPWFQTLLDRLVDASVDYLAAQIDAGAEVVQIFDSWAGDLPSYLQRRLVAVPIRNDRAGIGGAAAGSSGNRVSHAASDSITRWC